MLYILRLLGDVWICLVMFDSVLVILLFIVSIVQIFVVWMLIVPRLAV